MPRRIDAGDVLAAIGALMVLIALFLEWYETSDGRGANGWESFEIADFLLAALAIATLAAAASTLGVRSPLGPRALAPLGLVMLLLVVVQLIEPPPALSELDPSGTGAWLALAGAALALVGGLLRVARVSISVDVGGRDVRERVPAVDRRHDAAIGGSQEAVRFAPPAPDDPQATQSFNSLEDR